MAYRTSRLPSRFPVGTKFVVEGVRGDGEEQVFTRYLEFPDGTRFPLPASHVPLPKRPEPRKKSETVRRRSRR